MERRNRRLNSKQKRALQKMNKEIARCVRFPGKARFDTAQHATYAARQNGLRVYHCSECEGWHLTSMRIDTSK